MKNIIQIIVITSCILSISCTSTHKQLDYVILYPDDSRDYLENHKLSQPEVITNKDQVLADRCLEDYYESSLSRLINSNNPEFYGKYSLNNTDGIILYLFMPADVDDIAFFYTIKDNRIFEKGILSAWSVDYYAWEQSKKENNPNNKGIVE